MSDSAPSVPKAASEPRCEITGNPCGTDTVGNGYTCACPACIKYTSRTPASPVSGRNLTPDEQAAYTEFRKRHATKLSGPVSGETVAELTEAIDAFENSFDEGVPESVRTAARAALVALYERGEKTYEELTEDFNQISERCANYRTQLERLKADSEQRIKALEHMIELRDRVIDKQREDFEWLESEGIDVLTRNRDAHGIEDDRIVLWGDTAAENQIFSSLREAIDVGRRLSQSSESPK